MQPPEMEDETAARGHRLVPGAPLSQWHEVAALGSEEECLAVKQLEIDRTIDRAREQVGADAKYELPVRRAVLALDIGVFASLGYWLGQAVAG